MLNGGIIYGSVALYMLWWSIDNAPINVNPHLQVCDLEFCLKLTLELRPKDE